MNDSLVECARAALTHAALARFHAKQEVRWYEDGYLRTANPNDGKYTGAWLVQSNGWEQYYPADSVKDMLKRAEGFPFEQFE